MRRAMIGPVVLALCGVALAGCESRLFYATPSMPTAPRIGGGDVLVSDPRPPGMDEVAIGLDMAPRPDPVPKLRREGLAAAAQAYGAQMGYDRMAWEIERTLEHRSSALSTVYDFGRLVSASPRRVGYIVPPVVSRSFEAFEGDDREASAADEYLTVLRPGRISAVVPSWRDWLLMKRPVPQAPAESQLPTTEAEVEVFKREFRVGWIEGERQAIDELRERLARLGRDLEGMLQYRRLVSMGMMDRMVLADADFGVTGGGNVMRIGARTINIVSEAQFETDPLKWRPAPVFPGSPAPRPGRLFFRQAG